MGVLLSCFRDLKLFSFLNNENKAPLMEIISGNKMRLNGLSVRGAAQGMRMLQL